MNSPGLALTFATKSLKLFTPVLEWPTMNSGEVAISDTGSNSWPIRQVARLLICGVSGRMEPSDTMKAWPSEGVLDSSAW